MREMTKSMLSFSWAMPLFGAVQMVNWLQPDRATHAFDAVTESGRRQLGPMTESTFRAGDALQRTMVDLTFSFLDPRLLDPRQWTQWSGDLARRGMDAAREGVQIAGAAAPGAGEGPSPAPWPGGGSGWSGGGSSGSGFGSGGSTSASGGGSGFADSSGGWGPVPGGGQ